MASKKTTVVEWECDGCEAKVDVPLSSPGRPVSWSESTTQFSMGVGEYTKGLDLCEVCSKDPEAAAKRWKVRIGQ